VKPHVTAAASVPVLTVAGMRAWEQASWQDGIQQADVIEQVGAALATWIRGRFSRDARILLLCGKGHNGDDGRAAMAHLPGLQCEGVDVVDPGADASAVAAALARKPALVVDALFGMGLNRPLDPGWQKIVAQVNASGLPIAAVDVPSGLDADTGAVLGAAIRATWTLTVGAAKRGLIAGCASEQVGRLEVLSDVGLGPWTPDIAEPAAWMGCSAEFNGFPPPRPGSAHKGDFGHACIIAGSVGYHGAAVLAARAALRARPGLVTVVTTPDAYGPVASQLAAPMVRPWAPSMPLPARTSSVVMGPGLADSGIPASLREWLCEGWRTWEVPVIADASALDWIPRERVAAKALRVVTPHAGEAARLLNTRSSIVQADRPAALQALSALLGGAWVILKGQGTLVGRRGELPWWNPTGNPGLAQGGSGDVLAGFLGGSLAQATMLTDAERTLRGTVFRHGEAADRLETLGEPWSSEDLARAVRW